MFPDEFRESCKDGKMLQTVLERKPNKQVNFTVPACGHLISALMSITDSSSTLFDGLTNLLVGEHLTAENASGYIMLLAPRNFVVIRHPWQRKVQRRLRR